MKKVQNLCKTLLITTLLLVGCVMNYSTAAANTIATATPIDITGVKTGKITLTDSPTYYSFSVANAGILTIESLQYCDSFYVLIVDADEYPIWDSHNTPFWCPFRNMGGTETSPTKDSVTLALTKGNYYLKLLAREKETVSVNMGLTFESFGIDPTYGDSYDNPVATTIDQTSTGCMIYGISGTDENWLKKNENKEDWYKITVSDAGKYKFYKTLSDADNSPRFTLYDSTLNEIRFSFEYDVELTPGSYYMKVYDGKGKYSFNALRSVPEVGYEAAVDNIDYKVLTSALNGGTVAITGLSYSFNGTNLNIPDKVTIDGISYKVTRIEQSAFSRKYDIKSVKLGKNISFIGENAFYYCTSLKKITINSTSLTTKNVKANAFAGVPEKVTVKVPKAKISAYKKLLKKRGLSKKAKIK